MKQVKLFGLAALAALMAMAFSGVSSAIAQKTTVCGSDGTNCGGTHVHEVSVGKAKLLSSLPTIECNSLFLGDAESSEGVPLVINGHYTYTSCNNFCTLSEPAGTEFRLELLRTASELGAATGEGEVHVTCPFINCIYNGEGLEGHVLGPLTSSSANGNTVISGQETNKVSGSCPEAAFLDFTGTPLIATYIKAMICSEAGVNSGHFLSEGDGVECTNFHETKIGNYELELI